MLNLLVLHVGDVDRSLRFYELLGLDFTEERHGDGPVHYAATMPGGAVLELYPAGSMVTCIRLGFTVSDRVSTADTLHRNGFTVKRQSLAIDPDGNRVEITDSESISEREAEAALAAGLGQEPLEWLHDDGDGNVVERP